MNELFTEQSILKEGARFEKAYTFEHDGLTCLLFPFKEDMQIEVGKLAAWRLQTHPQFGGTWLSDYVPNRLGGFVQVQENTKRNYSIEKMEDKDLTFSKSLFHQCQA